MPDEFRIWKEKMDAIERKKLAATQNPTVDASKTSLFSAPTTVNNGQSADVIISNTAASSASASDSNIETSNLSGTGAGISNGSVHTVSSVSTAPNGGSSTGSRKKVVEEEDLPPPVYATQEEAVDAFKALLTDKRVRNPFNKPISLSCNLLYTFSIEIIDLKYCVLDADIASYYSLFIEFYQFSSSTANEFIDSL